MPIGEALSPTLLHEIRNHAVCKAGMAVAGYSICFALHSQQDAAWHLCDGEKKS